MRRTLGIAAVIALALCSTAGAAPTSSQWRIITFAGSNQDSYLWAVSASSASNVWAGGPSATLHPAFEHWDGSSWTHMSGLTVEGKHIAFPDSVKAFPHVMWAVGDWQQTNSIPSRTGAFIESYDGSSWHITRYKLGTIEMLRGIDGVSPTDLWAAGDEAPGQPLVLHYNGTSWSRSFVRPTPHGGELNGVVAISKDNVWAFGEQSTNVHEVPYLVHWNGAKWTVVTLPSRNGNDVYETGIAASSATDVWTSGANGDCAPNPCTPTVNHLTRSGWHLSSVPNPGGDGQLWAIAAKSSTDVWAVGSNTTSTPREDLLLHWNGSRWTTDPGPKAASMADIYAVTAVPGPQSIWYAVGTLNGETGSNGVVILRCC